MICGSLREGIYLCQVKEGVIYMFLLLPAMKFDCVDGSDTSAQSPQIRG